MIGKEKASAIFSRCGSQPAAWMGHVSDQALPLLAKAWGVEPDRDALSRFVGDDCYWIMAENAYHAANGLRLFDPSYGIERGRTLSAAGCFAEAETVDEVERYPWPNPDDCDFEPVWQSIRRHPGQLVMTGMWSPFFHQIADFFGMENYFIKMYESPEVVDAVTAHVVDFLVESSDRFWAGVDDPDAVMFFGNDFGTQRDLMLSPEMFRRFLLPSLRRLIDVGKRHGRRVILHSCGSIARIIPDLIDAGIDGLHPLQARAAGMSAQELKKYRAHLAFMGGIDAQGLMVHGTPEQIRNEVFRVHECLGPNHVISPSHEEILWNVPNENLLALMQSARMIS